MGNIIGIPFSGQRFGATRFMSGPTANPNSGPDSSLGDLAACALGSIYTSTADGSIWVKTGPSNLGNALYGTWTQK